MAEYIESICRRCFHSYVCEQFNEHRDGHNEKCLFFNDHFVPVADVVPVVHGRWEHLEQGWIDLWRCSACGDEWTFEYDPTDTETKVNYCPNCGARMDGE